MKIEFRKSFIKDLESLHNESLQKRVEGLIALVENASSLADIPN